MNIRSAVSFTLAGLLAAGSAGAATVWTGTAQYGNVASGAPTVGPFDAYGIGTASVLLQPKSGMGTPANPKAGDNYTGYFQSYISTHTLNSNPVNQGNLNNFTNSGTPYELTVAGDFTENVTKLSSNTAYFNLTGGHAKLYLSPTVNYNFTTDSGFTDGTPILTGNIVGGTGTFGPNNFGVTSLKIDMTNYNSSVFSPGVGGGDAVITLQAPGSSGATASLDTINSVMGQSYSPGDLKLAATGNMQLSAVPIPAAVWLFGSGLVGLVAVGRRRRLS